MQAVLATARRAAPTPAPVLITGESGVGKGALARLIHEQSGRGRGPLVQVNCAALVASTAEVELFGAAGDGEARAGLLTRAAGGTLFLDEVGELPLEIQPRLLEALESGQVRPVGASAGQALDVRVICATSRELEGAVASGLLRAELYWRLNVVQLHVPPLRERREDLLPLAEQLLAQHAPRLGHRALTMTDDARESIRRYGWPGNIRELDNLLYRAAILCQQSTVQSRDLGLPTEGWVVASGGASDAARAEGSEGSEGSDDFLSLPELERKHILRAMELSQGNKSHAARLLGIHRKTLYRKLEEQGMIDPDGSEL
jgi:DNA-binding NtrC family response regulator